MNARYALNAANARWGSLYDALYGSDIIPQEGAMVSGYDPQRGEQVIARVRRFLDESLPLENGSYQDVVAFKVVDKQLRIQLKMVKKPRYVPRRSLSVTVAMPMRRPAFC